MARWNPSDMPSLEGRTAVVTGANNGLGYYTTAGLASRGAHVVMACRNLAKAEAAREKMLARGVPEQNLVVEEVDLARLASVRALGERLVSTYPRIDLLINNAGLMAVDQSWTEDGHDVQFGVNHLAHVQLTLDLLPSLVAAGPSRVVAVSSVAHYGGQLNFSDPDFRARPYSRWGSYGQSKLANLVFARALGRRLAAAGHQTISVAAHPGWARTDLGGDASKPTVAMIKVSQLLGSQSAEAGALPTLRAATDPDAANGDYFGPRFVAVGSASRAGSSGASKDPDLGDRLWSRSLELLDLTEPEQLLIG